MSVTFYRITEYGEYFFSPYWHDKSDFATKKMGDFSVFLRNNKIYGQYEQISALLSSEGGWISKRALTDAFDQRTRKIFMTCQLHQKIFGQLDTLLADMIKKGFTEKRTEQWDF